MKWVCCNVFGRYDELVWLLESDILGVWCEKDTDTWDEFGDWLQEFLGLEGRISGACCATAHGYPSLGPIIFCTVADGNAQKVRAWVKGKQADRWCVLIDHACDILHELTHVVSYNTDDKPHDTCTNASSYAADNAMRWALLKRYCEEVSGASACDVKVRPLYLDLDGHRFHTPGEWDVAFKGCHES